MSRDRFSPPRVARLQAIPSHAPGAPETLASRQRLLNEIERAIVDCGGRPQYAAVIYLHVACLHRVERMYGSQTRHAIVNIIAMRLRARWSGAVPLGHAGGNGFAVVVPPPGELSMVLDLAGRLVAAFQRPVAMLDLQVPLRAAAGIATYPEHARTAAGLLTRAQTASYRVVISDADRCCRLGQYCEAH